MNVREAVRCFLNLSPYHDDELIVFVASYGDFAKRSKIYAISSIIDEGDMLIAYPFAEFSIERYTYPEVREETVLKLLPNKNDDLSIVIDVYQEILDQLSQQGYIPASRVYLGDAGLTLEIGRDLYGRTRYRKVFNVFYLNKNFKMLGAFDKMVFVKGCPICRNIVALYRKTKALFNEFKVLYESAPYEISKKYKPLLLDVDGMMYLHRSSIRKDRIYVGDRSLEEIYSELQCLEDVLRGMIDWIKEDFVKEKLGLSGLLDR
jgi:hypothetical protein